MAALPPLCMTIAFALLIAGCASPPQEGGTSTIKAVDTVATEAEPRPPQDERQQAPMTGLAMVQAVLDTPPPPANESRPTRPWWTMSVPATPEGTVASFPWRAPDDRPVDEAHSTGRLDVDVRLHGDVTAWTVFYVPADQETARVTGSISSVSHDRASRKLGESATIEHVPAANGSRVLTIGTDWQTTPDAWLILAATGAGRLEVAVAVWDGDLDAAAEPVITVPAAVQAQGARFDLYSESGSGTNVPQPVQDNIDVETLWTPGVAVLQLARTEPVAQVGEVRLDWEVPWAKWARIGWATRDNLGGTATSYHVQAGGKELTGVDATTPYPFGGPGTSASFARWVSGDGSGVDVLLAYTLANAGDFLGFSFTGVALGASMQELTGMPAAVVEGKTTCFFAGQDDLPC